MSLKIWLLENVSRLRYNILNGEFISI